MLRQKKAGIGLGVLMSLLLLAQIGGAAPSPAYVAEIIGINGQVEARRRGGSFSPAAILQKLASQDAVRTLVNSKAQLSFIDQSIMVLGEKSTLEISQYRLGEREARSVRALKVIDGKVRFIVNKFFGSGSGEPEVTLDTPTIGVGIRGTDGVIEIKGNTDYVYLFQAGAPLALHSKSTGERVDLHPGFFAVCQAGRPIRIFPLPDDLRRNLLRQLNFAFDIRPRGVAIEPDIPKETPASLGPKAGPTEALSPVYTPPVPAAPAPQHSQPGTAR
jgi:hypothetical protein